MSMNLWVQRGPSSAKATTGALFIDGEWQCYTLEDVVREIQGRPVAEWKVQNETAIPMGKYKVTMELSSRFGPDTLTVNNVPGFTSIRMHGGNTAADTDGCIIIGSSLDWDADRISGATTGALNDLKAKVKAALDAGIDVWVDVTNP